MVRTADRRAWNLAHAVGAVGEAERIGCRTVGTEHLLLAALADPAVRWAFRTVGVDRSQVQQEVDEVSGGRGRHPRPEGLTADAADLVGHATAGGDLPGEDDPDGAELARVLQELARRFLARTHDSDARGILDRLGVTRYRTRVLATIEHHARRARLPPDPADDHDRGCVRVPAPSRSLSRGRSS